jgi:hypothetical protein
MTLIDRHLIWPAKVAGPYKKGPKFQPLEGIAENGVGLGATILKGEKV